MSYLARLKQLENEKNSQYAPHTELTKLTEPPFVSYGGSHPAHIDKKLSDDALLRDIVIECLILVGEPQADWHSYIDASLADPDGALAYYSTLKRELQHPPVENVPTVKAANLIYTLQLGGFEFSLVDDGLSIEPVGNLTLATKELISKNESAIIAELKGMQL